jgi:serine/threonine protein kinase
MVALKIIDIEAMDVATDAEATGMENAQKEIEVLSRLRDFDTVNVNKFIEAFAAHSLLCIVSEYCPGGSLTTLRRATQSKLAEKYIRPVARELAEALRTVHAAGIIHRDVKCKFNKVDDKTANRGKARM